MIYPFFFQLKAERLFVAFIALKNAFFPLNHANRETLLDLHGSNN